MLDQRFACLEQPRSSQRYSPLPGWVPGSMICATGFITTFDELSAFEQSLYMHVFGQLAEVVMHMHAV